MQYQHFSAEERKTPADLAAGRGVYVVNIAVWYEKSIGECAYLKMVRNGDCPIIPPLKHSSNVVPAFATSTGGFGGQAGVPSACDGLR